VVGGFLVAVAAVVVFAAALSGGGHGSRHWVVAARVLPAGTTIGPGDLKTQSVALPAGTRAHAFGAAATLVGRTLVVPLAPGEMVEDSMLVPVGQAPTTRPVSIAVDPTGLDALQPGQPVDVLETVGSGSATTVSVVARGATLLAIAHTSSSLLAGPASGEVTLGVADLAEIEALVQASHAGTITLVAAAHSDGVGAGAGTAAGTGRS
jgi:Flp pilus assembly protein CpaB